MTFMLLLRVRLEYWIVILDLFCLHFFFWVCFSVLSTWVHVFCVFAATDFQVMLDMGCSKEITICTQETSAAKDILYLQISFLFQCSSRIFFSHIKSYGLLWIRLTRVITLFQLIRYTNILELPSFFFPSHGVMRWQLLSFFNCPGSPPYRGKGIQFYYQVMTYYSDWV
jgi:hypothetical protein